MSIQCKYCGQYHGPTCPMMKAIEYYPDGTVKRVEFKTANDYPPVITIDPMRIKFGAASDSAEGGAA